MVVKNRLDAIGVRPLCAAARVCNSQKYEGDWLAVETRLHFDGLFPEASVEVFCLARFVRALFFCFKYGFRIKIAFLFFSLMHFTQLFNGLLTPKNLLQGKDGIKKVFDAAKGF